MPSLGDVVWPPEPISTDRLLLRCTQGTDRAGYIELLCSAEANRYLGGPADRADVEDAMPAIPGHRCGVFAVEAAGAFIGAVTLEPYVAEPPRPAASSADALEISFIFHPDTWGNGYATEAVAAVVEWSHVHLPGVPVVLVTQTANEASLRIARRLGFTEVGRFVEHQSEQWCGVRH